MDGFSIWCVLYSYSYSYSDSYSLKCIPLPLPPSPSFPSPLVSLRSSVAFCVVVVSSLHYWYNLTAFSCFFADFCNWLLIVQVPVHAHWWLPVLPPHNKMQVDTVNTGGHLHVGVKSTFGWLGGAGRGQVSAMPARKHRSRHDSNVVNIFVPIIALDKFPSVYLQIRSFSSRVWAYKFQC